jgi:hypothetical protein
MGSKDLRVREKWQDYGGAKATAAEHDFFSVLTEHFKGTQFRIRSKPKEFNNIYVDVKLSREVVAEIYTPKEPIKKHGVSPDYAIDNTQTGKTIYVEVKRQDGWVEGGKRSDGRGNAHERSCKYFTPGLLEILRKKGNLGATVLPFWTVFQGDITRDPCRVREITLWYKGHEDHFFFWRNTKEKQALLDHFNKKIKPLLM